MIRIEKSCKLHQVLLLIIRPLTCVAFRMIHCTYPGCEYKSLQKSNVVNHTRKQYVCPIFSFSSSHPFPDSQQWILEVAGLPIFQLPLLYTILAISDATPAGSP